MPAKKVLSAPAFSAAKCAECLDNSNEGEADFPRVRKECSECWCAACCLKPKARKHCALCGGPQVCIHGTRRNRCKTCSAGKVKIANSQNVQRLKKKREEYPEQHRTNLDARNATNASFVEGHSEQHRTNLDARNATNASFREEHSEQYRTNLDHVSMREIHMEMQRMQVSGRSRASSTVPCSMSYRQGIIS